jgi:hypothetical protein
MRGFSLALIVGLLAATAHSQTIVPFCDVLRNPEKYKGKVVRVRATYRSGFEWSYLYCLDCRDRGRVWLDFSWDLDKASQKALKRAHKHDGLCNLTVEGTLASGGHYGHMGAYQYEFTANRVSDVMVVSKGMKSRAEEEAAERRWACGGSNPK